MTDDAALADRLLRCLLRCEQIAPPSGEDGGLSMARAYRVSGLITKARARGGERPVGRKIGFTNRTIWDEYGVSAPIFGTMYDSTVRPLGPETVDLSGLLEPRIEPEIAFRLASAPEPGMEPGDLIGCVSGICAGFELVQSVYPGWRFTAADTVAAFGLHGAFLHGPVVEPRAADRQDWVRQLADFRTKLFRNGEAADEGHALSVLGGGPLVALGHLAGLVAATHGAVPLAAGDLITTGTLTRALPVAAGETWHASFEGLPLAPIRLSLERRSA